MHISKKLMVAAIIFNMASGIPLSKIIDFCERFISKAEKLAKSQEKQSEAYAKYVADYVDRAERDAVREYDDIPISVRKAYQYTHGRGRVWNDIAVRRRHNRHYMRLTGLYSRIRCYA